MPNGKILWKDLALWYYDQYANVNWQIMSRYDYNQLDNKIVDIVIGTYTGTDEQTQIITLGFQPRFVLVGYTEYTYSAATYICCSGQTNTSSPLYMIPTGFVVTTYYHSTPLNYSLTHRPYQYLAIK